MVFKYAAIILLAMDSSLHSNLPIKATASLLGMGRLGNTNGLPNNIHPRIIIVLVFLLGLVNDGANYTNNSTPGIMQERLGYCGLCLKA